MVRQRDGGEEESTVPHFRSITFQVLDSDDLDHFLNQAFQQMQNAMEEFIHRGSNWRMETVLGLEIKAVPYQPLTAAKYSPLPARIQNLRGIINIQNDDEKCFLWCVLAALHPQNHNPQRVSHYLSFENELNMNGISFPTPLLRIKKFEEQNGISINVLGFEKEFFPLYISQLDHSDSKIDLLFETLVRKVDTCSPDPKTSSTTHEAHVDPCGYAYQVVCTNSKYTKPPVVHRGQTGENVVEHFLDSLLREEEYIKGVLLDNEPLLMTRKQKNYSITQPNATFANSHSTRKRKKYAIIIILEWWGIEILKNIAIFEVQLVILATSIFKNPNLSLLFFII